MKVKIVDSKDLSPRSLKAEVYITKPFQITYLEEVMHTASIHISADSKKEAESILRRMTEPELSEFLGRQKSRVKKLMSRDLLEVEEIKREI